MANHEDIADFTNKNIKILPPYVEELKRQVSLLVLYKSYFIVENIK